MPLNISNPETDRLARALSALTGESLTETITRALRESLALEESRRGQRRSLREEVQPLLDDLARMPDRTTQSADAILGYDQNGLFG